MTKKILIAIIASLLLGPSPGSWAQQASGGPQGWVATPKLHLKGEGSVNNAGPNYINGLGYYPSQIRAAYGFNAAYGVIGKGGGQTIAIVDAYGSPTIRKDVASFCNVFGLAAATLNVHYMDGVNGQNTNYDADWAMETSLDVEWAHALAPGATILLVVAQSNSNTDLFAAVSYAAQNAQVVSMSWGGPEFADETSSDSVFQNPETVFIASSGDSGSGTQYPAASPNVVAVGGTTLYLQARAGTLRFPEVAWEGAGGGVSLYEAMPSYQSTLGLSNLPGQPTNRCIPDVGFAADPNTGVIVCDSNYDPSTGNWWIVGGTSLAAPCWAAIVALANHARAAAQLPPLTDGHAALYNLAANPTQYATCYRDITAGYNGDFAALPGYDFITGIGSPLVNTLVPALKSAP